MSNSMRFGLVSENAYFSKVDQQLLENLREVMELQEEAERCAQGGSFPSRTAPSLLQPTAGEYLASVNNFAAAYP